MNQFNRDYEDWHRYGRDRGFFDRVSDEVRSWFGDEDAERRRQQDQHMDTIRGARHEGMEQEHHRHGREERPQWQERGYSGSSPRGSFINEHGRFDEPYREQRGGRRMQQRYYGGGYGGGLGYGAAERYGRREERNLGGRWNEDRMNRGLGYEYGYGGSRLEDESMRRGDLSRRNWEDHYTNSPRFFDDRDNEMYGSHRGRGPKNYQRSDERILDEIHQDLTYHPEIDATEIDVLVEKGIVTLRGNVDSRSSKRLAEDIAEDVYGVKEIRNELRVSNQSGLGLGGNNLSSSQQLGKDRIGNSR